MSTTELTSYERQLLHCFVGGKQASYRLAAEQGVSPSRIHLQMLRLLKTDRAAREHPDVVALWETKLDRRKARHSRARLHPHAPTRSAA